MLPETESISKSQLIPLQFPEGGIMANIAIRLNQKAALAIRKGHPWVFSDSIMKISREGAYGDTAIAFDQSGKNWLVRTLVSSN